MAINNGGTAYLQFDFGGVHAVTALSICGWAKITTDRNDFSTFLYDNSFGSDHELFQGSEADGTQMDASEGATGVTLTGPNASVGTWYWYMVTENTLGIDYYYGTEAGGTLTHVSNVGAIPLAGNLTHIYAFNDPYSEILNGSGAFIRRWDVALSAAEADAEWRSTTPVRTSNLYGDWRCASNATAATDSSGNGNNFTKHGTFTDVADPTPPSGGGGSSVLIQSFPLDGLGVNFRGI